VQARKDANSMRGRSIPKHERLMEMLHIGTDIHPPGTNWTTFRWFHL
jgi:hypothetical protein